MRLSIAVIALFLTLASIGCGESASPASPSSFQTGGSSGLAGRPGKAAATIVPLKGSLHGVADPPVFEPPPSPYFSAHLLAEGQATHLGRFTMDFSHRVNLETLAGIGKA